MSTYQSDFSRRSLRRKNNLYVSPSQATISKNPYDDHGKAQSLGLHSAGKYPSKITASKSTRAIYDSMQPSKSPPVGTSGMSTRYSLRKAGASQLSLLNPSPRLEDAPLNDTTMAKIL